MKLPSTNKYPEAQEHSAQNMTRVYCEMDNKRIATQLPHLALTRKSIITCDRHIVCVLTILPAHILTPCILYGAAMILQTTNSSKVEKGPFRLTDFLTEWTPSGLDHKHNCTSLLLLLQSVLQKQANNNHLIILSYHPSVACPKIPNCVQVYNRTTG